MKFKLSISGKIALGFGLFIAAVGLVFYLTNKTLQESRQINDQINEVYSPSLRAIENLRHEVARSVMLARQWVYIQSREDEPEKAELRHLVNKTIPSQINEIEKYSESWTEQERELFQSVKVEIENLFLMYENIEYMLPDFASYEDPQNVMRAELLMEQGEEVPTFHSEIQEGLGELIQFLQNNEKNIRDDMIGSFDTLQIYLVNISAFVIIFGVVIALITIRSIVRPVNHLKKTLLYLGKGMYPHKPMKATNDEIGEMTIALNRLVTGLNRTKEFSQQLGNGNFNARYQPLSESDELGHALLKMRDSLAENERVLESKVIERTNEVLHQKEEIEKQKEQVTDLYKDLTDSINYAKRIQQTILPTDEQISNMFPESFVLYRPRDIVSGDFYWFKDLGKKKIWAAVDCTGHGVPGAFMSLVGHNALNQVTKVFTRPASILSNLNRLASEALRFGEDNSTVARDGMDLAMCMLDTESLKLECAGAQNPIFIVRGGKLRQYPGDKMSIGDFDADAPEFTNHSIQLKKGDNVYVFSDGFADQFGGEKGKKFMKKQFRELILEISDLPMKAQEDRLIDSLLDWKGDYEQVDDILVIGVRV
ncbi:SpoIIE family protein phosphatase [Halocola ammonii]